MCFSATSSLSSAGLLTLTGIIGLQMVKSKRFYLIAAIPFIFALQQLIEGLFWLNLTQSFSLLSQQTAAILFLAIAFVIWPIWIPFSLWVLERRSALRKKILFAVLGFGILFAAASTYTLIRSPVHFYIKETNIVYQIMMHFPISTNFILFLYTIPTIGSFFISSYRIMWLLGCIVIGSLAISIYFKEEQLISIWCFFAALLSLLALLVLFTEKWFEE